LPHTRVFISSTYYDLKHVRASLDGFVRAIGFEPILSEKGNIAYLPTIPLDESCYREVQTADLFVLIIGGRYGAAASDQGAPTEGFHERYESITKREYETALERNIPIYTLVEKAVHLEYRTFLANRENQTVRYAHADSENVFLLLEEILELHRNNPIYAFDDFADVERWLKEQWSGLIHDLLRGQSERSELRTLRSQVSELRQVAQTLKIYLEQVIRTVDPGGKGSEGVIEAEDQRLRQVEDVTYATSGLMRYLLATSGLDETDLAQMIAAAASSLDLIRSIAQASGDADALARQLEPLATNPAFLLDINGLRAISGLTPLSE